MPRKVSLPIRIEESIWASMIPSVYRFAGLLAAAQERNALAQVQMPIGLYPRTSINAPRARLTAFKQVLKELAERKEPPDREAQFLYKILQHTVVTHRAAEKADLSLAPVAPGEPSESEPERKLVMGQWQLDPMYVFNLENSIAGSNDLTVIGNLPPHLPGSEKIDFRKVLDEKESERFYRGMIPMVVKTIMRVGWQTTNDPTCWYIERDKLVEILDGIGSDMKDEGGAKTANGVSTTLPYGNADGLLTFVINPDRLYPDVPVILPSKKYDGTRLIYVSEYFIKDMQLD